MTVPVVDCRLSIDASLTTCEDSYHIAIQAFNPINWSPAGPIIYNQVFSGQAPNLIEIPSSVFPPQSNGQFYILTFSAGLPWVPTYIGFWYTCKADIKRSGKSLEFQKADKELITLFPNPTNSEIILRTSFDSGTYQIYDLQGKILDQNILNTQNTVIDLSRFSAGTYFLKIETASGEIHFKKVIKE